MNYSDIDPIIEEWAKKHGLYIGKEAKDFEVRAIDIVDDAGNGYGVYISPPNYGEMVVNVAGHSKKKLFDSKKATISNLEEVLEKQYQKVEKWIEESGNTRGIRFWGRKI